MRYAKGSLVINRERDIPLLRQVRNLKFVSHHQLFEFMKLGGFEHSRNSFNWRIKRLLDSGHITICQGVFGEGSTVYSINKNGICLLEHHGQFTCVVNSKTAALPHPSQVFHSLELNAVQLALARADLLAGWQSEVEVASFNTLAQLPFEKDYDALVDVWIGPVKTRFALEYERSLKSARQYEKIRAALEAERQIECVLYLTAGIEVMVHLVHEFRQVNRNLAFAVATAFEQRLLDTLVTSNKGISNRFRDLLQSPFIAADNCPVFASL
jgi:hypothetical protein